jgi:hypothetical protein
VLLKSTGHHKIGTEPEEVEEEPTATTRAQDEQRRVTAKAEENKWRGKQKQIFFSYRAVQNESAKKQRTQNSSFLLERT